ncbi:gag/pol protein [Cucumis melo var. makuwa]|uniref:Gag/pol protein n=1 Tax=Cucumis melo var. makuwa TaxID=1194695 RepID=A0A5D3BR62_CUCMM|nr:gag/pol protein [Cucumis melo var. makuwa]
MVVPSMMHFNKVSFILEPLSKNFIPFQINASLNKIEFNLTTLLNELQHFQNLTKNKGKEVEENIATTKRKFSRGSSSKSKTGPSKPNRKIEKKGKGKTLKQNKEKKTTEKEKGKDRSTRKIVLGKGFLRARSLSKLELEKWSQLKQIERLVKSGLLSQLEDNSLPPCDSCLEGKMTKRSFTGKGLRAKTSLEFLHSDLCGPMNVKARGGYEYSISFIDDYSSGRVVRQPDRYLSLSKVQIVIPDDGIEDPLTYKQVMNYVDYDLKKWLATQFQMKDWGNAQYVLVIQIVRNQKNKTVAMSQTSYIKKMLSRSKMQNFKKGLLPHRYGIHL